MSLWLTLIWFVCAAICIGVFGFCRKRMADIGQQVAEKIENDVDKIWKQERDAELRLLEAFTNFDNPAEAIRIYQKIVAEIFPHSQVDPPWSWTRKDVELWRKLSETKEKASRSRSTVLATVIIILALNIAATVTTVIALNTIKPVWASPSGQAGIGTAPAGQMPQPVSVPPQSPPVTSPPPLPTRSSPPIPADDAFDKTKPPVSDVDNSIPPGEPLAENPPAADIDDRISSGIDPVDKSKLFIKPDADSGTSSRNNDQAYSVPKDIEQDVNTVDNYDTTKPSGSESKGGKDDE